VIIDVILGDPLVNSATTPVEVIQVDFMQEEVQVTAIFISIECPNPKFTLGRVSGLAEGKIIETYLFFENILKIKLKYTHSNGKSRLALVMVMGMVQMCPPHVRPIPQTVGCGIVALFQLDVIL